MNAQTYLEAITELVGKVGTEQAGNVQRAADLITESLNAGGVVQAFGSGHSEALAMEIAGRAGGLVPTNRIALRDIVLWGGEPREVLEDQLLERRPRWRTGSTSWPRSSPRTCSCSPRTPASTGSWSSWRCWSRSAGTA